MHLSWTQGLFATPSKPPVDQEKASERSSQGYSHDQRHASTNISTREIDFNPIEQSLKYRLEQSAKKSTWLSGLSLLLFALLVGILASTLIIVWYFDTKENGFTVVINNRYSLTYGPTAILVSVVAIWRQVDYHFKAATPWVVLHQGRASGKNSVLLDYVSPILATSFWRALRNRHFGIAVTISGFLLLKLITLASTGLFVVEPTHLSSQSLQLTRATKFNGSIWNSTQPYGLSSDSSIVYTAYGILARGLEQTPGTTRNLVYETFDVPPNLGGNPGELKAEVEAFVPKFNCEQAEVSVNPFPYDPTGDSAATSNTISIISPHCQLMGGADPVFVLDPTTQLCPKRQFRGAMHRVNCSTTESLDTNWQLLTLVEVAYEQVLNESIADLVSSADDPDIEVASWSVAIKKVQSLICRPSYSLGKLNIYYNLTRDLSSITTDAPNLSNDTLEGFQDGDLASRFTSALTAGSNMFGDLSDSQLLEDFPDSMFKLMAATSGGRYENLLTHDSMDAAAEKAFQQVAVQFASRYLVEDDSSSLNGTIASIENKLKVSTVPFGLMIAGFSVMMLLILCVFWIRPQHALPPYYENIYGTALILDQSPGFRSLVEHCQGLEERDVAKYLDGCVFSAFCTEKSNGTQGYVIEGLVHDDIQSVSNVDGTDGSSRGKCTKWWQPLMVRQPIVVTVLFLLLATVVVLEVLQRLSDNNQGILTVPDTSTTTYTRFVPALIMLILATSVNAIDFNVMVLAPFNSLKDKEVPAKRSLHSSLVDKLPPFALWEAMKHRHYAAGCSSTAAIIGSFLTIIVSGLYTPEIYPGSTPIVLSTVDAFNTSWPDSATNDSTAAVITSLTESLNLSYPAFTHDELAFPSLAPDPGVVASAAKNGSTSVLKTKYPALRASLNCSALNTDSFNASVSYSARLQSASATVEAKLPLPPACLLGGPGGNLSHIDITYRFGLSSNTSYIAKMLDLHVGPYDAVLDEAFGESDFTVQADNPPGCPSLAFIYGYVDVDHSEQNSATVLMCYQEMQSIQTTVTFNFPLLSISTASPPIPDESTIELLPSGPDGVTAFSYRIEQHMDQSFSMFNQTEFPSANLADSPVDGFFQGVLFGKNPLPTSMLVGEENQATMVKGINAFYRRYMAQAISSNMRTPVTANSPAAARQQLNGTITNASQIVRLVQHNHVKLTLQILLGAIAVLTTLAWKFTKLDCLVPYNPCAIFGVASLLAGSRMCRAGQFEMLREDADNARYKLDWWNEPYDADGEHSGHQSRKRRYGIDIVKTNDEDSC